MVFMYGIWLEKSTSWCISNTFLSYLSSSLCILFTGLCTDSWSWKWQRTLLHYMHTHAAFLLLLFFIVSIVYPIFRPTNLSIGLKSFSYAIKINRKIFLVGNPIFLPLVTLRVYWTFYHCTIVLRTIDWDEDRW